MPGDTWTVEERKALGELVGDALRHIGESLVETTSKSDHKTLAIAHLMQMAGDLTWGSTTALDSNLLYSSAALSRQLLEITDIIVYFRLRPERAEFWLTATDAEMKDASDFRPARLRRSAGSLDTIYGHHCSVGGHPRFAGTLLLPGSPWLKPGAAIKAPSPSGQLDLDARTALAVDLLQHLRQLLLACLEGLEASNVMPYADVVGPLTSSLGNWHKEDPYALIGFPPGTQ